MDKNNIKVILATDCGSTTTKAILIEYINNEYRLTCRGEAPTTVESPFEDVTRGVLNAVIEIEELSGRKILDGEKIINQSSNKTGVDIYISTSSAGGGLQMMVGGVVKSMTAESAERAALGAGAIVMDVLSLNDKRKYHEKVQVIRELRPDMLLLSGGIDGGSKSHVVELSEIIAAAKPKPRLGMDYKLPIIYAGNKEASPDISKRLNKISDLTIVDNIRPKLEFENLQPSRDKIHDLFMEHVMAQAPGYKKLMSWTNHPIMPTPGAVGEIIKKISKSEKMNVVGVDIGGATTDVFSVFDEKFNRTVSANLGMSYSICNVLSESGLNNIKRWLPFEIDDKILTNRIANKMIRPTTIPQSLDDLKVEQAIAREALSLSFKQHKDFAVSLKGIQQERTISDTFEQSSTGESLVDMLSLDLIVGSGGVISHAPKRNQAARLLIDSFLPEGITQLAVDSIFMMPQLGVLSEVHLEAALEVFNKDCLVRLGTCIAPTGEIKTDILCDYKITNNNINIEGKLNVNDLLLHELPYELFEIEIKPSRGIDMGSGPGIPIKKEIYGGEVGIFMDGRKRPINFDDENENINQIKKWSLSTKEFGE